MLSTTWHIKRDYDFQPLYPFPHLKRQWVIYDLTYQKGLRHTFLPWRVKNLCFKLSTTWHIKRDYDNFVFTASVNRRVFVIYDLTYQKGLRPVITPPFASALSSKLSTTWHIKRDYDLLQYLQYKHHCFFVIYDLTYQKGLRLFYSLVL